MNTAERIDLCIRFLRQHGYEVITRTRGKPSNLMRDRVVNCVLHEHGVGTMLTVREVASIVGASSGSIYRWIVDLGFPAPIKMGNRASRWNSQDVMEWVKRRQNLTQIDADDMGVE